MLPPQTSAAPRSSVGLPLQVHVCLFDLDGVLTSTAALHAKAWKQMFDDFLRARSASARTQFAEFDLERDYGLYVDGKPRDAGTRSFLASRGIRLPEGREDDPAEADTIRGLGRRKNEIYLSLLREEGAQVYPGSAHYLHAVRALGFRTAVVTSSKNCREVITSAGIADQFDARVDGILAAQDHLEGKPAPDTFLEAARELAAAPAESAVFEDALSGVEAGRAGRFGYVVGVDRVGQAEALRSHGADVVVSDLAELLAAP